MSAQIFQDAVSAVCPIDGVSIGRVNDRTTWRIDYKAEATPAQRAAAQNIMATIDLVGLVDAKSSRLETIKLDARLVDLMNRLKTATPAQISTWVDADVARAVKAILLIMAKEQSR